MQRTGGNLFFRIRAGTIFKKRRNRVVRFIGKEGPLKNWVIIGAVGQNLPIC